MVGLFYHFLSGTLEDFWSINYFRILMKIFARAFRCCLHNGKNHTWHSFPIHVRCLNTKTRAFFFFWRMFDRNVIFVWLFFVQVEYGPRAIHSRMPFGIRWRYERNYWQERIQVCDELNIKLIWSSLLFKLCNWLFVFYLIVKSSQWQLAKSLPKLTLLKS